MTSVEMCPGCHCPVNADCRDASGATRPMCRGERCSEHTSNASGLCRDCDLEQLIDNLECKRCRRMRYRTDTVVTPLAAALWGDPCDCP